MQGGTLGTEYIKENPKDARNMIYGLVVVIIILVIGMVVMTVVVPKMSEPMTPFYLDQVAMQYSDPTYMKFAGRDRDILGMSMKDYYLEHDMNSNNEVEPMSFTDQDFANTTDYLQMPRWYRPDEDDESPKPKTLAAMVMQPGNVTAGGDSDDEDTTVADDRKRLDRLRRRSRNPEPLNMKNRSGRERFLN